MWDENYRYTTILQLDFFENDTGFCPGHEIMIFSGGSMIPWEGAPTPEGGAPTYYLANFPQNLHENEEIFGPGGTRPLQTPPRPANDISWLQLIF